MIRDNDYVELEVVFDVYNRGIESVTKKAIIKGNYLDALKRMCDNMCLYIDSEYIEEEGMNSEDIIKYIEGNNGDGCDYIYGLKDLISGEVLIEGGEYNIEEW